MSKGQKSTSTTSTQLPSWLSANMRGISDKASSMLGADPASFYADPNPTIEAANTGALGLGGSNKYLDKAFTTLDLVGNYKSPKATAYSTLENLDAFMNPFTDQVVDTTLAGYDRQAGATRARSKGAEAATQAFNSSRAGIQSAELDALLDMNRAGTEAGLRKDAFNTGAGLAADEASRKTQVSMQNAATNLAKQNQGLAIAQALAEMGLAEQAGGRADIATQLAAGGLLYDIENAKAGAPLDVTSRLAAIQAGIAPMFATTTSTQKQSGGGLGALLSGAGTLAQGAGALGLSFSDVRLKRNIETLGHDNKGRRWVDYAYIWDEPGSARHVGVIAQEIAGTDPGAVHAHESGFLMVDYGAL